MTPMYTILMRALSNRKLKYKRKLLSVTHPTKILLKTLLNFDKKRYMQQQKPGN